MKLSFAPELTFQTTINGVNYYQFPFHWLHSIAPPDFPIPVGHKRGYMLTVAENGDTLTANIRDEIGLDFSSTELPREEFAVAWVKFIKLLTSK